jgi:hypothetical protein
MLFTSARQTDERKGAQMTKYQSQEQTTHPQLEPQKQKYQTPSLEQHNYLSLTGVILSIGGNVVPNPFELQELQ